MDIDEIYDEHLILATKVRRRNKLRLQLSVLGLHADPSISMQIEDLDKEIAQSTEKLHIKPEGVFIDTSVNLNDRRVILLQVTYDQSNVILERFAECIQFLLDYHKERTKDPEKNSTAVTEVKDKVNTKASEVWAECMALDSIFRENRLYIPKKADNAIAGFIKKIFRFVHFEWFNPEENIKDAAIEWDTYIDRAHRAIVDVTRVFIETEK